MEVTGYHHVALCVADLEAAVARLREKGIPIDEGPAQRPDGSEYLFPHDPDGNRTELTYHGHV